MAATAQTLVNAIGPLDYEALGERNVLLSLAAILAGWSIPSGPTISYPVLNIIWTWTGTNPTFWNIGFSANSGVTWTVSETVSGTARSSNQSYAHCQVRVQGVASAGGAAQTLFSNILTIP